MSGIAIFISSEGWNAANPERKPSASAVPHVAEQGDAREHHQNEHERGEA